MMEENLPPFEIFERIADERINEFLEPRLKTFRGELRQSRKAQEICEAEIQSLREGIRLEINEQVALLKQSIHATFDPLMSRVIALEAELADVRHNSAVNSLQASFNSCQSSHLLGRESKQMLGRKYEVACIELRTSPDPIGVASRYHALCMDEGGKAGHSRISPGLPTLP